MFAGCRQFEPNEAGTTSLPVGVRLSECVYRRGRHHLRLQPTFSLLFYERSTFFCFTPHVISGELSAQYKTENEALTQPQAWPEDSQLRPCTV